MHTQIDTFTLKYGIRFSFSIFIIDIYDLNMNAYLRIMHFSLGIRHV